MASNTKDSSESDVFYVLITGANAGLGYTTCTRLIANFLLSRPSSESLCLIPSVRSPSKGEETAKRLKSYVTDLANGRVQPEPVPRGTNITSNSPWPTNSSTSSNSTNSRTLWPQRIRIEPISLDLCALPTVYAAARTLASRYGRIDAVVCNAGIGGWSGISWTGQMKQLLKEGPLRAWGAPDYKICRVGLLAGRQLVQVVEGAVADGAAVKGVKAETGVVVDEKEEEEEPLLAEVFCANVFGHYVLVHELLPLLERNDGQERARVIWISTVEAYAKHFDVGDMQGFKSNNAYESSKRLTDLLVLSATTGDGNQWARRYLGSDGTVQRKTRLASRQAEKKDRLPPNIYLCHPGICITDILPIATILVWAQLVCFYLCRLCGSQWHNITKDKGVTAQVWLALEDNDVLESNKVAEKKWGSAVDKWGKEMVLETEVEDLGTKKFAKLGAQCWEQMEELRQDWDGRVRKWEASH